ncbi:hypothetical protein [Haloarcula rubripromontorii]|uniref:hypothetical protein n=1 Tax=Haloarcula rubripromontorii TaxID=1705562 RepID=UPI00345C15FA
MTNENLNNENDDADAPQDDEDEAQLYETTGRSLSRRNFLRASAAASAAAIGGGAGMASADHGSNDPLSGDGSTTAGVFLDDKQTVGTSATLAGPQPTLANSTASYAQVGEQVADALFDVFDHSDTQLESDSYYHGQTVQQSARDMLGLMDTHVSDAKYRWVAAGKYALAKALKNGKSESSAKADVKQAVLDAAANTQRNAIKTYEAIILRHHQFNEVLKAAGMDTAAILYGDNNSNGTTHGLIPIHVDLLNGETVPTYAIVYQNPSGSDAMATHPYAANGFSTSELVDKDGNNLIAYTQETKSELQSAAVDRHPDYSTAIVTGQYADVLGFSQLDSNNGQYSYLSRTWIQNNLSATDNSSVYADQATTWFVWLHDQILTVRDESTTMVTDAYSGNVDPDKLATNLVTDPVVYSEEVAGDWRETGSFGFAQALALQSGYESDIDAGMDVQVTFDVGTSDESTTTYQDTALFLDGWSPEHSVTSASVTDGNFTVDFDAGGASGDTVTLSRGTGVSVSHSSATVTSVTVEVDYAGSTFPIKSVSSTAIDVTTGDLEEFVEKSGYTWGDTLTLSVTAETSSAKGSATTSFALAEHDVTSGTTYSVPSGQSAFVIERTDSGSSLVRLEGGNDEFTLQSVSDADGNSMGGLTLANSGRYSVNNADIIEAIKRQKANQEEIAEKTADTGGGGTATGPGGIPLSVLGGGIVGILVWLYSDRDSQ